MPTFGGTALLNGKDITSTPLHKRISEGLAFVPQTENIFASLTVAENLQLAADVLDKALRPERLKKMQAMFRISRPGRTCAPDFSPEDRGRCWRSRGPSSSSQRSHS